MAFLAGYEVAAQTGAAIAGATVKLRAATTGHPNAGSVLATTTTDANGYWTFAGLDYSLLYDVSVEYTVSSTTYTWWYKGYSAWIGGVIPNPVPNLLVNGGFEVWQRGIDFNTLAHNAFGPDRWKATLAGTTTIRVQQEATTIDGWGRYSAKMTVAAWNSRSWINQPVEDFYSIKGRTLTFQARVHCNTASACKIAISDGVSTQESSYHTGNSTWQTLSVTINCSASATALVVYFTFDANCTTYGDNCMLVFGPVAADYVPLHPAMELNRCQRYYELHGGSSSSPVVSLRAGAAENIEIPITFATPKGGTPTMTKSGTWSVTNCAQPTTDRPYVNGYSLAAAATGAGLITYFTDSADDTIAAEYNP